MNRTENSKQKKDDKGIKQPSLVPKLELPKSGGAIQGIGEKYTANPATGTGNFQVPIGVTAGRGAPELSLTYSTGAGKSCFGLGWDMAIPSISRKTERNLPLYNDAQDSDTFILSGAEDLVKKLNKNAAGKWEEEQFTKGDFKVTRYIPRTEGLFARIEKWVDETTKDVHWKSVSGENITSIYGRTPDSRISNPNNPAQVFSWLLCQTLDSKGNITLYEYKQEDNANVPDSLSEVQRKNNPQPQQYLKRILYGNKEMYPKINANPTEEDFLFKVVFDYGEHDWVQPTIAEQSTWPCRLDAFSKYRSGFEIRTRRLCRRVLMFHTFPPAYNIGEDQLLPGAVDHIAGNPLPPGTNDQTREERLIQSTDLGYRENENITQVTSITKMAYEKEASGDYVKNDMPPLEFSYSEASVHEVPKEITSENSRNTPQGLSGSYQFSDINAEGLNGVLIETAGAWYYRRNLGHGQFDGIKPVLDKPNWSDLAGGTQLSNIESNGQLYLSRMGSNGGYTKREDDGSWSTFRNFEQRGNIDLSDPDIRYVDLNGDGRPELLLLRDELLRWYPNNGEKGYQQEHRNYTGQDENHGPARLFQNNLEGIYLNDMTGDGLSDIVRIRFNEICYWPNLGYGNFGEKVIMDNAPRFEAPDVFHPQNLRLADIDGSGTTDILYLAGHTTHYWLNHSGNGFSDAIEIKNAPPIHRQTTVSLVDLLGNGTACLVWSSPLAADALSLWKYIDIMNSTKPYLLTEVKNNMGSVTRSEYKPSTYFYLKDEREGRLWVTKLPFPVHVVHKTEIEDLITGHRFVSEYAYHHGYYDRAEREFRGFGFVEQWDDESFKDPKKLNPDLVYDKPRVHTKSWFHTGAWEKETDLSHQYQSEYWQQQADEVFLSDSELLDSDDWSAQEVQEAKRALRGQLLRSEVFTEDDSPLRDNPYVVTESRFQVKQLQPITEGNKHAVYISLPLEKVTATYDRNADDPRLAHEMTLEIDDFGNVLKSAAIAYPRLQQTDPNRCDEQYQLKIILTENEVFNQDDLAKDWYVKGVPLSAKTFEIIDYAPDAAPFISRKSLLADLATVTRQWLSAQVNYYRKNDDANELILAPADRLPFGEVQSLLLPYGTYQLIFTDDMLSAAYAGIPNVSQADWEDILVNEQYLKGPQPTKVAAAPADQERIDGWWVTDGFAQYDPDNFYTTTEVMDTWGNKTVVTFDGLGLLPIKVVDPLDNEITAIYDYRILQPLEITDPNGHKQQVAYDGFGRLIRTAIVGKNGEGDQLNRKDARNDFSESDTETSIIEYRHQEFYNTKDDPQPQPNYVHTYTREVHLQDITPDKPNRWMEARVYSDGFGQELQSKAKVAPGVAYYVEGGIRKSKDNRHPDDPSHSISKNEKRWLASGRTVYDNKGQAVKQYEPYFSTTEKYEKEEHIIQWGVSPFIHYDAVGRVFQTDMPDGTFTRVEFSPLMSKTFDANDTTALNGVKSEWYNRMASGTDAEKRAAGLSLVHADTPTIQVMDVLGRPVLTKQEVRTTEKSGTSSQVISLDVAANITVENKVVLDTAGNQLQVWDAHRDTDHPNGKLASEVIYDLVGRPMKSISNDAGTTYAIMSIDNQPLVSWLPNGHRTAMEYDQFRRPLYLKVKEVDAAQEVIKEATVYGEDHPDFHHKNMRGQVWKSYDQAGIAEVNAYDFKGAPLESTRYIFDDYQEEGNWSTNEINRPHPVDIPKISADPKDIFTTSIKYDALGRPTESTASGPDRSITKNTYDDGGALYSVSSKVAGKESIQVEKITYNEKGQRNYITYGNGTHTTYHYDELSYRLTRLHTTSKPQSRPPEHLQDIHYTYDAVGNIVEMMDKAQDTIYYHNQKVEPIQRFVYDSLNRLVEANGREHVGQQLGKEQTEVPMLETATNGPGAANLKALQFYKQQYVYDAVGNILRWKHTGGEAYTRDYTYLYQQGGNSNRLKETIRGAQSTQYDYDVAGNIEQLENHLKPIAWNFENQPTQMDFADSKVAHYRYDAAGERLRKTIKKGNDLEERIYLGNYEMYRVYKNGNLEKERASLHIADDTGRICIQEWLRVENGNTIPKADYVIQSRYQLSNHLGSVGIELDEDSDIISYEEYHPYGTTAFYWKSTTISQKRYRYTGKERDDESGLSYHSARYYMPWLGRWLSADPAGMVDGPCLYQYSLSNPVMLRDTTGKYGELGHYYTTLLTSLATGFDKNTSQKQAYFSQFPDEIMELDAVYRTLNEAKINSTPRGVVYDTFFDTYNEKIHWGTHAITGNTASKERRYTKNRILNSSTRIGSIKMGFLLHRLADTYAHTKVDNFSKDREGKDLYGPYAIGHGLSSGKDDPDVITNRPELFKKYASDLYDILSNKNSSEGKEVSMSKDEFMGHIDTIANMKDKIETIEVIKAPSFVDKFTHQLNQLPKAIVGQETPPPPSTVSYTQIIKQTAQEQQFEYIKNLIKTEFQIDTSEYEPEKQGGLLNLPNFNKIKPKDYHSQMLNGVTKEEVQDVALELYEHWKVNF